MLTLVLVAVSDFLIAYTAGRYQDARIERNCREAVLWDGLLGLFICVNTLAVVAESWLAVPWSVGGTMLGTAASFWRRT